MKHCILGTIFILFLGTHLNGHVVFGFTTSKTRVPVFESSDIRIFGSPVDTVKVDTSVAKLHSPKKAAIMSACLPGLGQCYNKKYWKLAVIYPIMGGVIYSFSWNQKYYKYYRNALRARYDDDPATVDPLALYPDDRIVTMKNYYQRYRDLSVIGFAAIYVLQIIDATVDAHLFYFDVGPDLSMMWSPRLTPGINGPDYGIGLQMSFR